MALHRPWAVAVAAAVVVAAVVALLAPTTVGARQAGSALRSAVSGHKHGPTRVSIETDYDEDWGYGHGRAYEGQQVRARGTVPRCRRGRRPLNSGFPGLSRCHAPPPPPTPTTTTTTTTPRSRS